MLMNIWNLSINILNLFIFSIFISFDISYFLSKDIRVSSKVLCEKSKDLSAEELSKEYYLELKKKLFPTYYLHLAKWYKYGFYILLAETVLISNFRFKSVTIFLLCSDMLKGYFYTKLDKENIYIVNYLDSLFCLYLAIFSILKIIAVGALNV